MHPDQFTNLTPVFVVASCTLLSACSEPASLSDYSTKDIVAEYHARLDEVINGPGKEIYDFTVDAGADISVFRENQRFEDLKLEVYEKLLPYAEAQNVFASALVGSLMTEEGKEYTDVCKGITFMARAARQGDPISASTLGVEYKMGKHIEKSDKLAYFWTKEAYHRSGTSRPTLEYMFEKDMSDAEKQQALEEWANWFPMHSEVILNPDYCG